MNNSKLSIISADEARTRMERAKENQINNIPDKVWQKIAEKIFYATSCDQNIKI